jgi:hypothetical protein
MGKLKLQTSFASGVCECFDSAVVLVVTTIKFDGLNTRLSSLFCDQLTNQCRGVTVATSLHLVADALVTRTRTENGLASLVINDLASEVLQRTLNAQTRLVGTASQLVANMAPATQAFALEFFVLVHSDDPR